MPLETNAASERIRSQEYLLLNSSYILVGFNNLLESVTTVNIAFYIY